MQRHDHAGAYDGAEKRLRQSEERFRTIFENAPVMIDSFDSTGRCVLWNKECERTLGWSKDEVVTNTDPMSLFYPDPKVREDVIKAIQKADGRFREYEVLARNGTLRTQLWANFRLPDGAPIAVGHDITERKRVERELRARDTRLQLVMEQIPAVLWTMDRDLRFTSSVGAALPTLGLKPNQVVGATIYEYLKTEDTEYLPIVMHKRSLEGESVTYTSNIEGAVFESHTEPLRNERGDIIGIIGIALDVTERHRTEERLKRSEERYSKLFQHSNDGVFVYDFSGNIIDVNEKATELLGYTRSELLGLKIKALVKPEARPTLKTEFEKLVVNGFVSFEIDLWRKDGSAITGEVSGGIVEIADRQVVQGIVRDVTERKSAERALRESEEQMRALATRLQSVREEESASIAREIHDELGQALTGLKMDVAWIKRRLEGEPCDETKGQIMERLLSIANDIDDTVNTVRRVSTRLRPLIIDDLGLIGALEWQTREFEDRTGINCRFRVGASELDLDSNRSTAVFRIYQEILTNVARHAMASEVHIDLKKEDGTITLSVVDNGRGVSDDDLRSPRALGILGMQERAQVCGGRVRIQRNVDSGTHVIVEIPST